MNNQTLVAFALAAATFLFVGSSFVTPFAGFRPDQFPVPQDDPPAQPAGYAFAIWGIIYLWLIISTVFGALKRSADTAWAAARLPLLGSVGIGIFWLAIASQSPIAATIMIWGMLAFALWALVRTPRKDRWLFRAPVALYAGWLTAASSVSLGLLGAGYGIVMGETGWALVVAALATGLGIIVMRSTADIPEFGIAVAWALFAVAVKSVQSHTMVAIIAGLCAMLMGALTIIAATSDEDH